MSELAHEVIPFGKYKGQPVSVLQYDKQYCEWLSSQDWFRERFSNINTLIINNFAKPEDTPEHNKIQTLFLNKEFAMSFANLAIKKAFTTFKDWRFGDSTSFADQYDSCAKKYKIENDKFCAEQKEKFGEQSIYAFKFPGIRCPRYFSVEEIKPSEDCRCYWLSQDSQTRVPKLSDAKFEVAGWDVMLGYDLSALTCGGSFFVEIKPSLGDDYPSVLRQMKSNFDGSLRFGEIGVLVFDKFTAIGATESQVEKIFNLSGFLVLTIEQIQANC